MLQEQLASDDQVGVHVVGRRLELDLLVQEGQHFLLIGGIRGAVIVIVIVVVALCRCRAGLVVDVVLVRVLVALLFFVDKRRRALAHHFLIGKQHVLVVLVRVHLLEHVVGLDEQAERLIDAAVDAAVEQLLALHTAVLVHHLIVAVELDHAQHHVARSSCARALVATRGHRGGAHGRYVAQVEHVEVVEAVGRVERHLGRVVARVALARRLAVIVVVVVVVLVIVALVRADLVHLHILDEHTNRGGRGLLRHRLFRAGSRRQLSLLHICLALIALALAELFGRVQRRAVRARELQVLGDGDLVRRRVCVAREQRREHVRLVVVVGGGGGGGGEAAMDCRCSAHLQKHRVLRLRGRRAAQASCHTRADSLGRRGCHWWHGQRGHDDGRVVAVDEKRGRAAAGVGRRARRRLGQVVLQLCRLLLLLLLMLRVGGGGGRCRNG